MEPQNILSTVISYPLPVAISTFIVTLFGIFGNSLILLAIWTTKELHSRCYFLIAYLAIVDMVVCFYYSSLRIFIFIELYNMSNSQCFLRGIYGLYAMNVQAGLTLSLALDRYFAISLPTRYRRWNARRYLVGMTIPPNIYALLMTTFGYLSTSSQIHVPVCMPPTAYSTGSRTIWTLSQVVISIIVIILYTSAQFSFWKIRSSTGCDRTMLVANKVFRTLAVVMIVYCATWASTFLIMMLITFFLLNTPAQKVLEIWLVWPVIINACSNSIIYFWRSSEFRRAFKRLLRINKLKMFNDSSVVSWAATDPKNIRQSSVMFTTSPLPKTSRLRSSMDI